MSSERVRAGLGLSQVELAALVGVHPITVSKWERGISRPRPYQAMLLEAFELAATVLPDDDVTVSQSIAVAGVLWTLHGLLEGASVADRSVAALRC